MPRRKEGEHILAVLWEILLHKNNKLFRGRAASIDRAVYDEEGLVAPLVFQAMQGWGKFRVMD